VYALTASLKRVRIFSDVSLANFEGFAVKIKDKNCMGGNQISLTIS
jgi:hypothetical protein